MDKRKTSQFAAVILAAGASSRFGSPKILIEWNEEILIHLLCRNALEMGLSPVRLVLGAYLEDPKTAVGDLPVEIIVNEHWKDGMGVSLKKGVENLPVSCEGAFLILGDMPYLDRDLISALISTSGGDVVKPVYNGKPGHPVLWRCSAFPNLLSLKAGQSPRQALFGLTVKKVDWDKSYILNDIDSKEDYDAMKKTMGLSNSQ